MNTIEVVGKTQGGQVECAVRSDAERDLRGVIEDPYAHIMTVAHLMGYTLTIQDTSTTSPMGSAQQAEDRPAVSPYPKSPPAIAGTEETEQL